MSESERPKRPGQRPDRSRNDRPGPDRGAPDRRNPRNPRESGGPREGGNPRSPRSSEGDRARPPRASDRDGNPRTPRASDRDERPRKPWQADGDRKPRQVDGDRKPWQADGDRKPRTSRDDSRGRPPAGARRDERGGSRDDEYVDRDPYGIRSVRNRHDDPNIPDDVTPQQLDRVARAQLKTLAKENADIVASHLVMAARLIDEDPALAHEHATSAARKAGRIGVVRETLAITAYTVGDFALALRELRTYRRISGRDDQIAMMVDSERGLGRPDRALELGRSVDRSTLPADVQAELAIAMSGARLDLGQLNEALAELEIEHLNPDRAFPWSPALFSAYAAVLEDLGRDSDATVWYRRADIAAAALSGTDPATDEDFIEVLEEEITEHAGDDAIDSGDAAPTDREPTDTGPTEGTEPTDDER